jgi:hypothetical protein
MVKVTEQEVPFDFHFANNLINTFPSRPGPRHVGVPRWLIIWHPFIPTFFKYLSNTIFPACSSNILAPLIGCRPGQLLCWLDLNPALPPTEPRGKLLLVAKWKRDTKFHWNDSEDLTVAEQWRVQKTAKKEFFKFLWQWYYISDFFICALLIFNHLKKSRLFF